MSKYLDLVLHDEGIVIDVFLPIPVDGEEDASEKEKQVKGSYRLYSEGYMEIDFNPCENDRYTGTFCVKDKDVIRVEKDQDLGSEMYDKVEMTLSQIYDFLKGSGRGDVKMKDGRGYILFESLAYGWDYTPERETT